MTKQQASLGIVICLSVFCIVFCLSLFTGNWRLLIDASPVVAILMYYVSARMQNKRH
ncbi:hypothetical protein ACPBEH_11415 (plasmid) [Latilactobacillus sp. 5-91]|uniref:hypothetical protein n=1 Tax=Latilactobacillus sp. 5-91 TaxID=3410924 RepID=UPI003C712FA3